MDSRVARNRQFLADLFAGPFRGHGLIVAPPATGLGPHGDFLCSKRPVRDWVAHYVNTYRLGAKQSETYDDDLVPYVPLNTNTGLFAAAFGCPVHVYEGQETNAAARPLVKTAAEAGRLREPDPLAPPLNRVFELCRLLRKELGPDVPLGIPDIQSPFNVAALIWDKEAMFLDMVENPAAVKNLTAKCHRLLTRFIQEFRREFGEVNLCHCPYAWAPPDLGCWLSEDEVGAISGAMFDEFCLPVLTEMSCTFGGLFMHCCATADHQYEHFKKIPNLRGLNRNFQGPGPLPAIRAFAGRTVLIQAWTVQDDLLRMLDMALPDSRFLFNVVGTTPEELWPQLDILRPRCGRPAGRQG